MDNRLAIRKGRPPTDAAPRKARFPCRYYALGSCSKGVACQFAHEGSGDSASSSSSSFNATSSMASQPEANQKVPCRFFARGICTKGASCPFSHEKAQKPSAKPSASASPSPALQPSTDTRSQVPCQFFAKGGCKNGGLCPFAHLNLGPAEDEDDEQGANESEEPPCDDWVREFGGALATFDDGAMISKVSLPSDFSAVRLNKLPKGSSPASVAALLADMHVAVSAENVRVTTQAGVAKCSAEVKVEDPMFAKTVCAELRRRVATSHIEAIPIPAPMPRGSSLHRVDCRRVHCSWYRPTCTAWLNFGTENIARRVGLKFNSGVYKLPGCNVKASAPTGKGSPRNPLAWTIMLTDLASTVRERDIYEAIPEFSKPRHVEMGKASYDTDADVAATVVKSMLLQLGPLEWWEVSTNSKGKRIKAQARFLEESDAREAVSSLNNTRLSFSKTARLTLQLITLAKFKVSTRIYDALCARLRLQAPVWESQYVHFVAYPPHQGHRVLKLEGGDSRLVARAKETLERILGGEVLREGERDLWSPSLERNGEKYKRLKQVEHDYGVVVMRDRQKSQLRLFGSEESCTRAAKALATVLEEGDNNSHIIELNQDEFQWACRGGFKALASRLGDNKADFDIASTPKRILIDGSRADYAAALAIIASRQVGPATTLSDGDLECSVCWTEAEEPVRTSCNHIYCMACFADLCQAGADAATEFRICCFGGDGRCEKTLALAELQELLSSAAFEAVLEASFASYIRHRPAEFRYCPTPDCCQIYRAAADGTASSTTFTCTKCLIPTCTACHGPHPGMTCAEYQDLSSGGYEALEKIKKKLGIKDCPKCKTAIEKTEGCNHMTCRGCGTHICWICLTVFDTSQECYAHLNEMHGGVFNLEDIE